MNLFFYLSPQFGRWLVYIELLCQSGGTNRPALTQQTGQFGIAHVRPGDQLEYEATIEHIDDQAAATGGIVRRNGEPFGRIDIVFSHIDQNLSGLRFPAHNFVFTPEFRRLLSTYQADLTPGNGGGDARQ